MGERRRGRRWERGEEGGGEREEKREDVGERRRGRRWERGEEGGGGGEKREEVKREEVERREVVQMNEMRHTVPRDQSGFYQTHRPM